MTDPAPQQTPDEILARIVQDLDLATTGDLIRAARRGERTAFGELCQRLMPWLESVVAQQWRGYDRAFGSEDLMSTVMRRAFEHREDFAGEERAQLHAWLRRIVGHAMLDVIRRARAAKRDRRREISLDEFADAIARDEDSVFEIMIREEDRARLRDKLASLAEQDREVLRAVFLEGATLAHFADHAGISTEAAKKRSQRALQRLGPMLARE